MIHSKRINLPLVSIIIVNWNGREVMRACLKSLSKIDYPNWELVFVDNGSVDGSEKVIPNIKLQALNIQLIKNRTNLGFAKANNQGFKVSSGKYILLLNNDTKVNQNFLSLLVDKLEEDSTIGVIQPKIFIWDKPGCLDNVASYLTKTGFLQYIGYMEKDNKIYNNERFTFSAKGACMLIRRGLIEKAGLFDEDFGSYFEESDFCWRVWLLGYKVLYFPKAFIYHKVGFSSKRQDQTFVFYHSLKNRLLSMIKNLEFRNLVIIGGLQFLLINALSFYYLFKFQTSKFLMIQKAVLWNIAHLKETLKKRRKVQNLRKMRDNDVFKYILKPTDWQRMRSHFGKVEANFNRNLPQRVPISGRVRVCLELLQEQDIKGEVVVDIGSSFGWLEREIVKLNPKQLIGIEPDKDAVVFAQKSVKNALFLIGDALHIPLHNNFADTIILYDVIEHVPRNSEPLVLDEINRVLKKNGKLLFSTPNHNFFSNIFDIAWYFGHRHYSKDSIKKMLESKGFKIEKVMSKGSVLSSLYLTWFYIAKRMLHTSQPRNNFFEKLDDLGYKGEGITDIFLVAKKLIGSA